MAEWEGFEPSRGFKTAYSLSRGAPSASWVSLRINKTFSIAKVFYHVHTDLSSAKVDIDLTFLFSSDIFVQYGEMSERFKELVLKTSDGATHREFESHTLRQQKTHFCLLTKVRFLNDVCLRQMMLGNAQ